MGPTLPFVSVARDPRTRARAGLLRTPHGDIETPAFMPVGTSGTVKGMTQSQLEELGVQILLANTYHLYLRPGHEVIRELGGLHQFMSWPHPILTDSGGFQVMSLEGLSRVTDDGVWFRSHLDGSRHFLSPERAVEIQYALGADIIMTLDECVPYPASRETVRRATKLTGRWARRAKEYFHRARQLREGTQVPRNDNCEPEAEFRVSNFEFGNSNPWSSIPSLFGIVQGGMEKDLRRESAEEMIEMGFEGYALGGLSVGEPKNQTYEVVGFTAGLLPADCPRYAMGVGTPADLVECAALGVDLFDCVLPTRNARNGCAFTSEGKVVVKSARYAGDERPLDPDCPCPVCRRYSRAYLRHLFNAGEMLAAILATHHNLYFYLDTMRKLRQAILSGEFEEFRSRVRAAP